MSNLYVNLLFEKNGCKFLVYYTCFVLCNQLYLYLGNYLISPWLHATMLVLFLLSMIYMLNKTLYNEAEHSTTRIAKTILGVILLYLPMTGFCFYLMALLKFTNISNKWKALVTISLLFLIVVLQGFTKMRSTFYVDKLSNMDIALYRILPSSYRYSYEIKNQEKYIEFIQDLIEDECKSLDEKERIKCIDRHYRNAFDVMNFSSVGLSTLYLSYSNSLIEDFAKGKTYSDVRNVQSDDSYHGVISRYKAFSMSACFYYYPLEPWEQILDTFSFSFVEVLHTRFLESIGFRKNEFMFNFWFLKQLALLSNELDYSLYSSEFLEKNAFSCSEF